MNDIYYTDDYPRAGCRLEIVVGDGAYGLRVFSPDGRLLESYARVSSPRAIARMVEEWARGFAPKINGRLD